MKKNNIFPIRLRQQSASETLKKACAEAEEAMDAMDKSARKLNAITDCPRIIGEFHASRAISHLAESAGKTADLRSVIQSVALLAHYWTPALPNTDHETVIAAYEDSQRLVMAARGWFASLDCDVREHIAEDNRIRIRHAMDGLRSPRSIGPDAFSVILDEIAIVKAVAWLIGDEMPVKLLNDEIEASVDRLRGLAEFGIAPMVSDLASTYHTFYILCPLSKFINDLITTDHGDPEWVN